jgi:hypothetical protein
VYEEAQTLLEQVDKTYTAAGSLLMTAVVDGNLGRLAARKGLYEDAHRQLTSAFAASREVALSLHARSRLTGDAEDAGEAQRLLDALHVVRVPEVPL